MKKSILILKLVFAVFLCSCATIQRTEQASNGPIAESKFIKQTNNDKIIVFVHGVFGDAISTWTSTESGAYWPQLIADDVDIFGGVDVFVANFPSPMFKRSYNIDELADDLRRQLEEAEIFDKYNNVIFLCHSMGGLVVRQYIVKNYIDDNKVPMIYFFSTPSTGSNLANVGTLLANNSQLFDMHKMTTDSPGLIGMLQGLWLNSTYQQKITSFCAYEVLETYGVQVVERESATALCNARLDPINKDHIDIVKPKSNKDAPYIAFKQAFLKMFRARPCNPAKTYFSTDFDDDNIPINEVNDASLNDKKLMYVNEWRCLELGKDYPYSIEVKDGDDNIIYSTNRKINAKSIPWFTRDYINMSNRDFVPGIWKFKAQLANAIIEKLILVKERNSNINIDTDISIFSTGDIIIDKVIYDVTNVLNEALPTEDKLLTAIRPLFTRPAFYIGVREENWDYFLYALCLTRIVIEELSNSELISQTKRAVLIDTARDMVNTQYEVQKLYGDEFSISEYFAKYANNRAAFIDNLPEKVIVPGYDFYEARDGAIRAIRSRLTNAKVL